MPFVLDGNNLTHSLYYASLAFKCEGDRVSSRVTQPALTFRETCRRGSHCQTLSGCYALEHRGGATRNEKSSPSGERDFPSLPMLESRYATPPANVHPKPCGRTGAIFVTISGPPPPLKKEHVGRGGWRRANGVWRTTYDVRWRIFPRERQRLWRRLSRFASSVT